MVEWFVLSYDIVLPLQCCVSIDHWCLAGTSGNREVKSGYVGVS